jgi:hypothetical protein
VVIYPSLMNLRDEEDYRKHYAATLCRTPVTTHDGIIVRFRPHYFNHAFSLSLQHNRQKDSFSFERAERMDWIRPALTDPDAELYYGWDRDKGCIDYKSRVALVQENYMVIARLHKTMAGGVAGEFVTAYVGSASTLVKVRANPAWAGLR